MRAKILGQKLPDGTYETLDGKYKITNRMYEKDFTLDTISSQELDWIIDRLNTLETNLISVSQMLSKHKIQY